MMEKVVKIKIEPGTRNNKHFNKVRNALIDLTQKRIEIDEVEKIVLKQIERY